MHTGSLESIRESLEFRETLTLLQTFTCASITRYGDNNSGAKKNYLQTTKFQEFTAEESLTILFHG